MKTRFIRTAMLLLGLVAAASGAIAAQEKKNAPSVTGAWSMSVDSPHGPMTMGLTLKQEGKKVTGTFASPHGDLPVEGELVDGTLTLATVSSDPDALHVTFSATFKDTDVLSGYLSSSMGDMKWTAERVAAKR